MFGSYRIMASDDLVELLEEHKLPISIASGEAKQLMIDLQHFIESDKTLTIITSSTLGYHECFGGLVTTREMKLPNDHTYDYRLDNDETQLTMVELREKLEKKKEDFVKNVGHNFRTFSINLILIVHSSAFFIN